MQKPETGYLLIADITGYTRFLKDSELEHARGILEQLFSALLAKLRSPFALSNIQGDAILAHARAGHVSDGRHVLDTVESLYCGFADALETMLHNTTCTCAACSNIAKLDLKLLVHYGSYVEQSIAGRQELGGPDVILIHRLLKNSISSTTGIRAYAAFTEAAANATGLAEYFGHAVRHQEKDETFGEIPLRVLDMRPVWEAHRERSVIVIGEHDARVCEDVSVDLADPAGPGLVLPHRSEHARRLGAERDDHSLASAPTAGAPPSARSITAPTATAPSSCSPSSIGGRTITSPITCVCRWAARCRTRFSSRLRRKAAASPCASACRSRRTSWCKRSCVCSRRRSAPSSHAAWTASLAKLAELAKADAAAGRAPRCRQP